MRYCVGGGGFGSQKQHSEVAPAQCGSVCWKMVLIKGIVSQGLDSAGQAEQGKPLTPLLGGRSRLEQALNPTPWRELEGQIKTSDGPEAAHRLWFAHPWDSCCSHSRAKKPALVTEDLLQISLGWI